MTLLGLLGLLVSCSEARSNNAQDLKLEEWGFRPISTDARFVSIRDMTLIGDGLWVLDGAPPFLTRISLETGDSFQQGEEGEGPGEFLAPWAIQPTSDSAGVLVWDFGSFRTTRYGLSGSLNNTQDMSREGQILARSNFKDVSYADPFRVRSTPTGYLAGSFDRRLDLTADFSRGWLRLSGSDLDPGHTLLRFSDLTEPGMDNMREWAPVPFWEVCDGSIVVWSPATQELVWFNQEGIVRDRIRTVIHPTAIERQDIERYLEWMARLELGPQYRSQEIDYSVMATHVRDRFARIRPAATDLRCGGSGGVWIRLFDTEKDPIGRSTDWLLVSSGGLLRHVRMPDGFSLLLPSSEGLLGFRETPGGDQVVGLVSPPSARRSAPTKGE